MLKNVMLEEEMEFYLKGNGYKVENEEGIDSILVVEEAINLGYNSYSLDGIGKLAETLVFIKE